MILFLLQFIILLIFVGLIPFWLGKCFARKEISIAYFIIYLTGLIGFYLVLKDILYGSL